MLFVFGFGVYATRVLRGKIEPHFGSWVVWTFISVSNAIACFFVMDDLRSCFIPCIDAVCVTTFLASIAISRRGQCRLSTFDKSLVLVALLSVGAVAISPDLSTMLVQIPLVLAVVPTIKGALAGEEDRFVWLIWTAALVVNLAMTSGDLFQWVYPVVMFALHAAVLGAAALPSVRAFRHSRVLAHGY